MLRFTSSIPLQIYISNATSEIQNTNTLKGEKSTDSIIAAIRPQLKSLSLNTHFPAGEIAQTPFPNLKDDTYALSGMVDADVFHKQQKTIPILLTGPEALRHIVKTQAETVLEDSPKQIPKPAAELLVNQALGHNCYHEVVAGTLKESAQMIVVPNKNPEQAKQTPWLIASLKYPVIPTITKPVENSTVNTHA
jgi:hypothetical protein